MEPQAVVEFAREHEVHFVDVKFTPLTGGWRHLSLPARHLEPGLCRDGIPVDPDALGEWLPCPPAGPVLLRADPASCRLDPFPEQPTLSLLGSLVDAGSGQPCWHDPRALAQRAEDHLRHSGPGGAAHFQLRIEFYLFDDVRFDQTPNSAFYFVDAEQAHWNSGRDEGPNLGYKTAPGQGGLRTPPADTTVDLRHAMVDALQELGIAVTSEHAHAGSGNQAALTLAPAPLLQQADNLQWCKYVLKNLARRHGKALTFLPKPLRDEPGSSLVVAQSLDATGDDPLGGDQHAGLSATGLHYLGGILHHARGLSALCNPTVNSYRRLSAGAAEAPRPTRLVYSENDPSAACRVAPAPGAAGGRYLEYRAADAAANGYLALAALTLAGLDGVRQQLDPGPPDSEGAVEAPRLPDSLEQALAALEADHQFLFQGETFPAELVQAWIHHKREREITPLQAQPTPGEFALYFDC